VTQRRRTGQRRRHPDEALGVDVDSAAIKHEGLDAAGYCDGVATTLLYRIDLELAAEPAVHALTDVAGFGILCLELPRGAGLTLRLETDALPLLPQAAARIGRMKAGPARIRVGG